MAEDEDGAERAGRSETNRHGLSRYIPAETRRVVRQACGFGCVVCGNAVIDYAHVDPEFPDATVHDPEHIALLCGSCHDNVTRRRWSIEKVKEARAHPRCLQDGFSFHDLDTGANPIVVTLGSFVFVNPHVVLRMLGEVALGIASPEQPGAPIRLTARFHDQHDRPVMSIVDNELRLRAECWDAELTGPSITIRDHAGSQALVVRMDPRKAFLVNVIRMRYRGAVVAADESGLLVMAPDGSRASMPGGEGHDNLYGIDITEHSVSMFYGGTVRIGVLGPPR